MRILQLHTEYRQPGGEDAVVAAEGALLRRRGHEVLEHHTRNPAGTMTSLGKLALAPWNPLASREVQRRALSERPDVAHIHNTWYALSPAVITALHTAGVPVVMTLHNYRLLCGNGQLFRDGRLCEECVGSHPWHGVRHGCYRQSTTLSVPAAATIALHKRLGTWTRQVDLFLVITEDARQRFLRGGLPVDRIRIKSNFVADPGPRIRPAAESPEVLFVGRLSPEKGVDVLLEAWGLLGIPSLHLSILGDGPVRRQLESRAIPGVRFEGHVPESELRRRMLTARALVLPSVWHEPAVPLVVLEALAAGLPVVSSAVGDLPRLLGPREDGWLVAPGDTGEWVGALQRLADGCRIDRGSGRSRRLYEERFTETIAADALEDAYASAVRLRASGC